MNYMAHLKALEIRRSQTAQSTYAIVLYTILMEYNNRIGWDYEWFTAANSTLKSLCGFTELRLKDKDQNQDKITKKAREERAEEAANKILERARLNLVQGGYIKYKKGNGNQAGSYFIVRLGQEMSGSMSGSMSDTMSGSMSDTMSDSMSDTMSDSMSDTMSALYKPKETKPNQTKDKSSTNVLPKETRPRFTKPTLEEINAYCQERGNGIDPNRFYDYYESNGWKVGKNSMKDWKATIRSWETRQERPQGVAKSESPRKYTDTSYDLNELEKRLMNEPLQYE